MPIETFNFLDSLVASNPVATEGLVSGDDHIRGIKSTLLATLPGVTQALTRTGNGLIAGDGTLTAPAVSFASEPTLGIFRESAGVMAVAGGVLRSKVPGEIFAFAGSTAPVGSFACDGASLSTTTYAALFAAIGYTWGGSGANFNVPNFADNCRFLRHRGSVSGAVGNKQSSTNATHTHGVNGNTADANADHTHTVTVTGTSGAMSANANHSHTVVALTGASGSGGVGGGGSFGLSNTITTSSADLSHTHSVSASGTTSGFSSQHQHGISITSGASGDATEARPFAATVLYCIAY